MIHAVLPFLSILPLPPQATPPVRPRVLLTLRSPNPGSRFGAAIADAGDLDRDGRSDIVVGSPRSPLYGENAGNVRVHSGADGRLLWELQGQPGTRFGTSVASPGDVDGDGFPELLIGAPFGDAFVHLFSGRHGTLLFTFRGDSGSRFGASLAGAGDVDGDGVPDVVIGEPHSDASAPNAGRVWVHSGATGELLFDWRGTGTFDFFGHRVAAAGDLDADGHGDVLVGAPFVDAGGFNAGGIAAYSGATGAPLYAVYGTRPGDQLGTWLASGLDPFASAPGSGPLPFATGAPGADDLGAGLFDTGAGQLRAGLDGSVEVEGFGPEAGVFAGTVAAPLDCDGDGTLDLITGAPSALGGLGTVSFVSGQDGSVLLRMDGSEPNGWFGGALATLSDVDGDGAPDLAIGAPGHEDRTDLVGAVYVVSFGGGPGYDRGPGPPAPR